MAVSAVLETHSQCLQSLSGGNNGIVRAFLESGVEINVLFVTGPHTGVLWKSYVLQINIKKSKKNKKSKKTKNKINK